ncbi:hypothetical protein Taro_029033 [Colocasia esculenta]|uniref:NAC domain-containing protein n=1 Tax=Colocasia esculenta TaxID=4460 RepID=A0A843VHY1_COLES|nr:hypothetical protein [Colocasia esculenta]
MVAAVAASGWSGGVDEGGEADDGLLDALLMGESPAAAAADVQGGSRKAKKKTAWPPGFRFHPTDEELVLYYLKRKICRRRIRLEMVAVVDVYKCEPWELPEKSILQTGDKQWYFFSPRDRKYPNGWRSNRATNSGYWKATGKDRTISQNARAVGTKKTLVFYKGRAPKGERTDWVMHEYAMDEQELMKLRNVKVPQCSSNSLQDSYALYKVYQKGGPGPRNGEQYGAPFQEEWTDDDPIDDNVTGPVDEEIALLIPPYENVIATPQNHVQGPPPMEELEMFLLHFEDESGTNQVQPSQLTDSFASVPEVEADTEFSSHILEPAHIETSSNEGMGIRSHHESVSRDAPFQFSQQAPVKSAQDLEATSEVNHFDQGQESKLEDFLEICDLGDNGIQVSEAVNNTTYFHENDVFFDPFEDFLPTIGLSGAFDTHDQVAIHPYQGGFAANAFQLEEPQMTSQLWSYDLNPDMSAVLQTNQNVVAPSHSGTLAVGSSMNQGRQMQEQGINVEGTPSFWLSSVSTMFINAVPTRPAFASESEFVGRALERVSSFRAGRALARNQETVRGGGANVRRGEGRNNGLLFLSFLVALGAVFWVFTIGALIRILKAVVGRFASS